MAASPINLKTLQDTWDVMVLFLIPIGGGIPGGVLLAKARGIAWPFMVVLYFLSDVILAFLFEPVMKLFIWAGRKVGFVTRFIEVFKRMVRKSAAHYGNSQSPVALVLISFGVDPMTGRAAAVAAGHGFVTGWLIAIAGDMIYFSLLMVCTLWLSSVLGDGTSTMAVILVVMIVVPSLVRRIRNRRGAVDSTPGPS